MADNKQLTRIVAPNINEVDYAEKMQTVFDNINENFAKIASLPFIQGVQGDSYQLVEKQIWDNNAKLTKDGALLLESIFNRSFTENPKNLTFNEVRTNLSGLTINNVNPIDFFIDSEGNITNNILYFYAVINDSGEAEEKQLGQYYYFVDARLKVLGDVYYSTNGASLSSFTDYTGFYQYKPATETEKEKYEKISILPSLYYDQYKDDICWKFNGNESGISAMGVKGSDGKDSSFQIVHVTLNNNEQGITDQGISNTTSGKVDGVFKFNTANTTPIWDNEISKVTEGNAIISITYDSDMVYLAYGEIRIEDGNPIAYWNLDTVIDKFNYGKINSYFYNMRPGSNIPVNAPRHIAIPAVTNLDATEIPAHTISNDINNSAALKFQYTSDGFIGPDSSQKELPSESGDATHKAIFENYNVEIKKGNLDISKGSINIGETRDLGTINKDGKIVKINYTPEGTGRNSYGIQLNVGGTTYEKSIASINIERINGFSDRGTVTIKPRLSVDGDCYISNSLTVNGAASLNSGATITGGAIISNGATIYHGATINGDSTFNNNVRVKGKATISNGAIIKGNIYNDGTLFHGSQAIGGWRSEINSNSISDPTIITSNFIGIWGKVTTDITYYFKTPTFYTGIAFTGIVMVGISGFSTENKKARFIFLNNLLEPTSEFTVRTVTGNNISFVYYIPGYSAAVKIS